MIFGFSVAIVAGFILTAIQNWTGVRGLNGWKLAIVFYLWLLGRVCIFIPIIPSVIILICCIMFYPALIIALLPYYLKDRELKFERIFFIFITLLMIGDTLVLLDSFGFIRSMARTGYLLGMNTIIMMMVFMGGRVIPFFTEGTLIKNQPQTKKFIEIGSVISAAVFLFFHTILFESKAVGVIAFIAAIFNFVRLRGWFVKRVKRISLLWVLHLAYLWIVIGYFSVFLSSFGWVAPSIAIHAFTVGGIGMMVLGMISRVSLGHTGRILKAPSLINYGFIFIMIASSLRLFVVWMTGNSYGWASQLAALLWILGFSTFVLKYYPILISPRIDGKEG
jgi:uncharacterized protein involved in response to NO